MGEAGQQEQPQVHRRVADTLPKVLTAEKNVSASPAFCGFAADEAQSNASFAAEGVSRDQHHGLASKARGIPQSSAST